MRSLVRSFGALVGFALIALFMTGPAAAWDSHAITHLTSPVAVDEHHHHDDDGAVTLHDEGSQSSHHSPDDVDGGHDHMPSLFAAMTDLPPEGPIFPTLISEGDRPVPTPTSAPPDIAPIPQIRPPRFA